MKNEVQVFGVDQSPWVQGVLYALSCKGIDYNLTTKPPFLFSPIKYGLVIPVVSYNKKHLVDSFRIYEVMNLSDDSLSSEESLYVQKKVRKTFFSLFFGALWKREIPKVFQGLVRNEWT